MKYIFLFFSFSVLANPTKYAISAALNHVGWDINSKNRTIEIETPSGENFEEAKITVIDKGYLDDSVLGKKWVIEVKKNSQGRWERKSVKTVNICARGQRETTGLCN
jgi:hypothetical protein